MPQTTDYFSNISWHEFSATAQDWDRADGSEMETALAFLHLVRAFEEGVLELASEGLIHGPAHSSIGQEGAAVGSILALRSGDQINGSHRGHRQFLAKALHHLLPGGLSARAEFDAPTMALLRQSLARIVGVAWGICGGRGGWAARDPSGRAGATRRAGRPRASRRRHGGCVGPLRWAKGSPVIRI